MARRIVAPCLCVGALLISSCTYYSEAKQARAEAEAARAQAEEEAARARAQEAAWKAELARAEAGAKKKEPQKPEGKELPPYPSEAEARASLRSLLSGAGVNAEIVAFKRTDWCLTSSQTYYGVAYEAELAFRTDCRIKETMTLMWSEGNSAVGWGGAMREHAVGTFKKGDRKKVRGHIGYVIQEGHWKLESGARIDAGK